MINNTEAVDAVKHFSEFTEVFKVNVLHVVVH